MEAMQGAARYGTPLAEVRWRLDKAHPTNVYAQHGPIATDDDPLVAMTATEALAGYLVRLHNQIVEDAERRRRRG